MNERVSHHRVVSGVPRDAQTPAYRPHTSVQTLRCVLNRMHQTCRAVISRTILGARVVFFFDAGLHRLLFASDTLVLD